MEFYKCSSNRQEGREKNTEKQTNKKKQREQKTKNKMTDISPSMSIIVNVKTQL